jgi:hypothetical protein
LTSREHTYRSARIKEAAMAFERDDDQEQNKGVSRRGFLTGLGAGAAGAAGAVVLPPEVAAQSRPPDTRPDRFSRLFPTLRPFFNDASDRLREALRAIGEPKGLMDAQDPLQVGPIRLITEPNLSPNNLDNPAHTAGTTFFGQFLDHDMTFDTTSPLGVPTRPERSPNARTPTFDLDTVYGGGPAVSRHLYQSGDRAKFILSDGGQFEDLPRNSMGQAIIPDPRNDENMMISGIQVAMLMFHNAVVEWIRRRDRNARDVFDQAREIVIWHYHWIILNEFLPQIVGANVVRNVFGRRDRIFKPDAGDQSIPVEFQLIYRFGHSLIRPSYRANLNGDKDLPFFGFIFDENPAVPHPAGDPNDLRGGFRAHRRFIGWQTFFNFGNIERPRLVGTTLGPLSQDVRPNKLIDTKISTPLFNLPLGTIAGGDPPTVLPQRNLLRHVTWSVPSGQAVAQALRIPILPPGHLRDLAKYDVGRNNVPLDRSTPLWFYILKEAEVAGGQRLVGVGARVVAEVFIGLLQADPNSFLNKNPRWRPTLPTATPPGTPGTFKMIDLLTFAGVDPTSRGQ